jgi:hypothetical protein
MSLWCENVIKYLYKQNVIMKHCQEQRVVIVRIPRDVRNADRWWLRREKCSAVRAVCPARSRPRCAHAVCFCVLRGCDDKRRSFPDTDRERESERCGRIAEESEVQ